MKQPTDIRKKLIAEINKGKISNLGAQSVLKYVFDKSQRKYVLEKLSLRIKSKLYCNPLPVQYSDLCRIPCSYDPEYTLHEELKWAFDIIDEYQTQISKQLPLIENLECSILSSNYQDALNILDQIDESIGTSFNNLVTEFYINENSNNSEENRIVLNELLDAEAENKLVVLAEYNRLKVDNSITAWQYDAIVEQHKSLYDEEKDKEFLDYVIFKLDPNRYDLKLDNLAFITSFENNFAVIDRYNSLKKLLVLVLTSKEFETHKELIFSYCEKFSMIFNDPYWDHLLLLNGVVNIKLTERNRIFFLIQDHFLNGEYENVIEMASELLKNHPNYSENYIFLVQALLFTKQDLEEYLKTNTELFEILKLIKNVLEKNSNYSTERENLLKKYYAISQFEFSIPILEFILNEYNLSNPLSVQYTNYLFANSIRYNFYKQIQIERNQKEIVNNYSEYQTYQYLAELISSSGNYTLNNTSFFSTKIKVGFLMSIQNYESALNEIQKFKEQNSLPPEFVETWLIKNSIKCQTKLRKFDLAADLLVEYFFKKNVAYAHFYDKELFDNLAEPEDENSYSNISIPLLFQIYSLPTSTIYDSIANFLINNKVEKPSELLRAENSWDNNRFNYLLEKCFTMENLEDSPFMNSIEALEQERITILNYLKEIDSDNEILYNEDILKIAKEAGIRKGLMQIHESRIYVDVVSLNKSIRSHFTEVFERYLEFTDVSHASLYSLKLTDGTIVNQAYYFFINPVDTSLLPVYDIIEDYTKHPNVQVVSEIRYKFFHTLFLNILERFVYDEDYGFKSFLSMRIRHGTFSNVLRNVFDKFNLVSSKESYSIEYGEINYWNSKFDAQKTHELQRLLKNFSENIDAIIDEGLSWVQVRDIDGTKHAMFDFEFSQAQIFDIFRVHLGRLTSFGEFIDKLFEVLFERLEFNLDILRKLIQERLTPDILLLLDNLEKEIETIGFNANELHIIEKEILDCRTEIQLITSQIVNWFKISKNQYIEEFPIELILQTIIDYMNSINKQTLSKAGLAINNLCHLRFKGKYFETFGDIFINLFDNIISKNKELAENLKVEIDIKNDDDKLWITFKNNFSGNADISQIKLNIKNTIEKIKNYQNGTMVSFEQGSGYLKLCKSISVDLARSNYNIVPDCDDEGFKVNISFDLMDLTI